MIGPIVIGAALLYLALTVAVINGAIHHARSNGKSPKLWGWSAALLMYLIPFWDLLPTIATHQFHCATEGGFWIYKTPAKWRAENPGVLEQLIDNNKSPGGISPTWPEDNLPDKSLAHINQRFDIASINHLSSNTEGRVFLNVWRWKYELLDRKTGDVLARQIDFSTGNGYRGGEPPIKFWLQSDHCPNGVKHSRELSAFLSQFKGRKE